MSRVYPFLSKIFLLITVVTFSLVGIIPKPTVAQDFTADTTPLNEQELHNLIAFSKLYGYVRHFHPSDEAATADWHQIAVEGAAAVEHAASTDELIQVLESIFIPIAPTVQIFRTDSEPPTLPDALTNTDGMTQIIYWEHHGYGYGDLSRQMENVTFETYDSDRKNIPFDGSSIPDGVVDPRHPFTADFGNGVSASVPIALFAAARPLNLEEPDYDLNAYHAEDRATRFAAVIVAWNVLEHFYPYFDVIDTHWENVLSDSLTEIALASNHSEALQILRHLVAQLQDGHGGVYSNEQSIPALAPYSVAFIEGQVVIVGIDESAQHLFTVGDIVLAANNQPTTEIITQAQMGISSATPQFFEATFSLWFAFQDYTQLTVEKADEGEESVFVVNSFDYIQWAAIGTESRPAESFVEIEDGIWYVDLTAIGNDALLTAHLWDINQAGGNIIFDMRGYPDGINPKFLGFFHDTAMETAQFLIPIISAPHQETPAYEEGGWEIPPLQQIDSKVVFMTDGRAISYAETLMAFVENFELGEIVGIPTAGTNGNVNSFFIPGGFEVQWTGMLVRKHDGSQHHGIGIQPTIPVERTIEGVRAGRDEILDAAIEVVRD